MTTKTLRVVVRADAGVDQGSGHVVRCLTLAEELAARGHDVFLAMTVDGTPWLAELIESSRLRCVPVTAHRLDAAAILAVGPDRVVVDSYLLDAGEISELDRRVPVLAIVDGELRGIEATLYLDQNVGSELKDWAVPAGSRMLAGPEFALVRSAIRARHRPEPWRITGTPRVLAFMGGTDATGAIVPVARTLAGLGRPIRATVIAGPAHSAVVEQALADLPGSRILPPQPDIAALMAEADLVVAASGSSAWEVGTLGLPAVLLAVAENQRAGLAEAVRRGFVLGIDLVDDPDAASGRLGGELVRLVEDEALRRSLSETSTAVFDGRGAERVAAALESVGH